MLSSLSRASSPPDFVEVAGVDHLKFAAGQLSPQVECDTPEAVEEFLRERFQTGLGSLDLDPRWRIEGARACTLTGARVGLVMLRCGDARSSIDERIG